MQTSNTYYFLNLSMQGAGLELTQIPVSDKEKNYLDEQHTHLLQCLEKATVCAYVILKIIYTLPDTIARQDSQHIAFYKSPAVFLEICKRIVAVLQMSTLSNASYRKFPLTVVCKTTCWMSYKVICPSSYTSLLGRASKYNFAKLIWVKLILWLTFA